MKFGAVPVDQALGATLAHSVRAGDQKLRKGLVLDAEHIAALRTAGKTEVVVARLAPDDLDEDAAARQIAARIMTGARNDMRVTEPFTGRVNLISERAGVLRLDAAAINRMNAVDPALTVATLPDYARVAPGTMLATVKVIPYAVPRASVEAAANALGPDTLAVSPWQIREAALILTETDALSPKLLDKGADVVRTRLAALDVDLTEVAQVPHEEGAIATALKKTKAPLRLILGASATSDPADVCPAALTLAGGHLERFGMPVDPGNLLFLGTLDGAEVVGLPGCARSPALNGADWVLERLVAGLPVTHDDIAAMGVGGLLKEIPTRPQPRALRKKQVARGAPRVAIVLLAAGQSRRMQGTDKLLCLVDGMPLLRRSAEAALGSAASEVVLVLPPNAAARRAALDGLNVRIVTAETAAAGMSESLKAGVAALTDADAAIIALADMPEVRSAHLDLLIRAFDPDQGAEICRATAPDGTPGHPVLFGKRFFESLRTLEGDQGARTVLRDGADFVRPVVLDGDAATLDLDTPEDWAAYQSIPAAPQG